MPRSPAAYEDHPARYVLVWNETRCGHHGLCRL
jgi:hypothetical protein